MVNDAYLLLSVFMLVLTLLAYPLGRYVFAVAQPQKLPRTPLLSPLERGIYRLAGVNPAQGMNWQQYAWALLLFNLLGIFFVVALQLLQGWLPLNPQGHGAPSFDSALNTAVSFVANTNWQGYAGETTMSYLTQMLGLAVQNFVSAATGVAVVFALIRGLANHQNSDVGNFWVDLVRVCVHLLLPIAVVVALVFVAQGSIQNFAAYVPYTSLEGQAGLLPMGPNASQEVIKMLGTNGGGFFNANSAHPYSNPTYLTNFLQMLLVLIIPAALCFCFGHMVGDARQGWTIYAVMSVLFVLAVVALCQFEYRHNPAISEVLSSHGQTLSGNGNWEGKESRFGIAASVLFSAVTTAASCGAVNNMHDSLLPMGGLVPMFLMQTGEVVFGGVGSGLYGMLVLVILTVFLAGLMVGRTPEYLGKKIEAKEMKAVAIAMLVVPSLVLLGTASATFSSSAIASLSNPGPHGLSQFLYAFTSAANNNGSAFAGLGANTPFFNYLLAIAMLVGRFGVILPVLAVAGAMAVKKRQMQISASFPTHGLLFALLLVIVIVVFTALTYIPVLVLGPVMEHLQLFY
ncbi:potassium-transporting ATPase subunit KdpA [Vitreoscilla massiliensis]|uniref:Potassium-transporting ATPase potassium-binding subunit n=1 Tax=Vitreoscilla massiliensis TaxID=1689272 RepID=A0ABY4E5T5_9NEIS|nr:potassium-transporting ATPase subunit KdpA [Vitreoscilla massiliensis]UOO91141.1 potassium-transporting ATPase subunit KdpA [Vitreoscilla massiliensis]